MLLLALVAGQKLHGGHSRRNNSLVKIIKRLEGASAFEVPSNYFFCSRLLIESIHDGRGAVVAEGT